jgi:hypothetical protein
MNGEILERELDSVVGGALSHVALNPQPIPPGRLALKSANHPCLETICDAGHCWIPKVRSELPHPVGTGRT